jgi:hypothetical protein
MFSTGLLSMIDPVGAEPAAYGSAVETSAARTGSAAIDRLRPITLDASGSGDAQGTIERSGDDDWFTFTANRTGRVTIRQRAAAGSRLDSYLYAYDQQNRLLGSDDDGGEGLNSRLDLDVVAGRQYRLRAAAYGRSTGAYQLLIRTTPADDHGETPATATRLTLGPNGSGHQRGTIGQAGDVDMFTFTAPVSGRLTIRQQAVEGSRLDSFLYIYDSDGRLLGQNDDSDRSLDSRAEITVTAGRQYFVKAAAYGRSTGDFRLTFETSIDDHGNTIDAATPIAPAPSGSGRAAGVIERCGDADMFTFVAPVSGRMTIRQAAGNGSRLDSLVSVYDSQGRLLGQNDDSDCSLNSRLEIDVVAGQRYFVKASAYGCSRGAYQLQFDTVAPPTPAPVPAPTPNPTPAPTSGYQVDLVVTGFSAAQQQILRQAAQQWQQVIVGDVPDQYYRGRLVDDVLIEISAQQIDGRGGILGYAHTTDFRAGSWLPYHGEIVIDTNDVSAMSSRDLQEVMAHEIGHILGFGVIWGPRGLLVGAGTSNPGFTGARAVAEYNALYRTNVTAVPVEAGGGPGTQLSHWRESVFGTELMTGWHNSGRVNPLSRITVASMADIGYQVNLGAAEPFAALVAAPAGWQAGYAAARVGRAGLCSDVGLPAVSAATWLPMPATAWETPPWSAQVDAAIPDLEATVARTVVPGQQQTQGLPADSTLPAAAVDEALAVWQTGRNELDWLAWN